MVYAGSYCHEHDRLPFVFAFQNLSGGIFRKMPLMIREPSRVRLESILLDRSKLDIGRDIGFGGYGVVYEDSIFLLHQG